MSAEPKLLKREPVEFNGDKLLFYKTKYAHDDSLAIICETENGEPYATVSINLAEWLYFTVFEGEIHFNHDLPRDFKEMFCEEFCDCTLSSCEKVQFGPYNVETEKVCISGRFL